MELPNDDALGCCFLYGKNSNGQLGIKLFKDEECVYDQDNCTPTPTLLDTFFNVKHVSTGVSHTSITTSENVTWSFGSGAFGKLGIGYTEDYKIPEPLTGWTFVQIACANEHTLALTDTGSVYSWGYGSKGRLGLGTTETHFTPMRVRALTGPVRTIHAGGATSAAVSADYIYTWGYNKYGQLGHGHTRDVHSPTILMHLLGYTNGNNGIKCLSVGDRHMGAIDNLGNIWCWGSNAEYQLGDGGSFDKLLPTKLKTTIKYEKISCGGEFTCAISDTLCENGLYIWGTFLDIASNNIKRIGSNYQDVSCSHDCGKSILAIKTNGEVMNFGWSRYGQCGSITDTVPISRLESIVAAPTQVDVGSYHSAILFKNPLDITFQLVKTNRLDMVFQLAHRHQQKLIKHRNFDRDSLLHILAKEKIKTRPPSTLDSLFSALINESNVHGSPPFFYHGILIKWYAQYNPKILTIDKNGRSLLHYYCIRKMFDDIEYALESQQLDERLRDNEGKRAFDYLPVEEAYLVKTKYGVMDIGIIYDFQDEPLALKLKQSLEENHITVYLMNDASKKSSKRCIGYISLISPSFLSTTRCTSLLKELSGSLPMISVWATKVQILDPSLESCIYRSQLVDFSTTEIYQTSMSTLMDGVHNMINYIAKDSESEGGNEIKTDNISVPLSKGSESIFLSFEPSQISKYKELFNYLSEKGVQVVPREKGVLAAWVFVVIVTSKEFSPLVRDEISLAENRNKPILAIYYDNDYRLDQASRYTFAGTPIIKYDDQGFDQLLFSLKLTFSFLNQQLELVNSPQQQNK